MKKKNLIEYWRNSKIIRDRNILRAFEKVPRENFILNKYKKFSYLDEPLPILNNQTISQPTTVAFMTQALEPKKDQKILEIGTGSGYQAAILSEIVGNNGKIITIERIPELFEYAKNNLKEYSNIKIILGDGSKGYEEEAPYDRIIVTAAAPEIPKPLFDQLKEEGILLIPCGGNPLKLKDIEPSGKGKRLYPNFLENQNMLKVRKIKGEKNIENLGPFVFVPLLGKYGF